MASKTDCEIWLAINEHGDYVIATDKGDAIDELHSGYDSSAIRVVKLTVSVAPPSEDDVSVDVPDEAGETVSATAA